MTDGDFSMDLRNATTRDGARIAYRDGGGGEPALLLLPGWASSSRLFDPIVPLLARGNRVLTVDWRGHGESAREVREFGVAELVNDAEAVIDASGAGSVIPVCVSHAGWVGIELRRVLGERVRGLVFLDWIVLDPPPPFLGALAALQDGGSWRQVREQLFSMWLAGSGNEELTSFLAGDMGGYEFEMWARAGREIAASYREHGSPLRALAGLKPPVPAIHIYAQPEDPGYLDAQKAFARENRWFRAVKLNARTHFPMFETPREVAVAIRGFVAAE